MCLEQSEQGGERKERMAGRGRGRSRRVLWAPGGLGFLLGGRWEPWRAGGREAGPDSGAHARPLVAAAGRTDCGDEGWELWTGGGDCGVQAGGAGGRPGNRLVRGENSG